MIPERLADLIHPGSDVRAWEACGFPSGERAVPTPWPSPRNRKRFPHCTLAAHQKQGLPMRFSEEAEIGTQWTCWLMRYSVDRSINVCSDTTTAEWREVSRKGDIGIAVKKSISGPFTKVIPQISFA